jgi:hypothetical protein
LVLRWEYYRQSGAELPEPAAARAPPLGEEIIEAAVVQRTPVPGLPV